MSCWECCTSIRMAKGARPGRIEKGVHRKRERKWQRPPGSTCEPGPRISWGCAGNRRRSRRGPRCRVRTGSGLCGSRLSPHERAAPNGGAAETVMAGAARAAVVRDDGRRSGRQARGRSAPYATGTGRATGRREKSDETRGIEGVSRQSVARGGCVDVACRCLSRNYTHFTADELHQDLLMGAGPSKDRRAATTFFTRWLRRSRRAAASPCLPHPERLPDPR